MESIFISSTSEDLKEHRQAARDAVLEAGCHPLMFEYWAAGGNPPLDECLKSVEEADVLIVLVAHRYGWVPPDQPGGAAKSITWLECERAGERGLEVIPFLVDLEYGWPHQLTETFRLQEAAKEPDKLASLAQEVPRNLQQLELFKDWLDTRSMRKLFTSAEDLKGKVVQALYEWRAPRGKANGKQAGDDAAVREYLERLHADCGSVELLGLEAKDAHSLRLGQIYVPALTSRQHEQTEPDARLRENPYELLLHRLGEASLYVPGAPGGGKSVFCRWLALSVAGGGVPGHTIPAPEDFQESLPRALTETFPLLCRLRDLAGVPDCLKGNGQWTQHQLEAGLVGWIDATRPQGLNPDLFRQRLQTGPCLLVFDGVDELPVHMRRSDQDHYPRRNFLTGLAHALPQWHESGHRVLVTSRPYGLSPDDRRRLSLTEAALAELPPELQNLFIHRWYCVVDPKEGHEKADALLEHLRQREDLSELTANPMLLTALCVRFHEGQRLPRDIYELYDTLVDQVLYSRYLSEADERTPVRHRLGAIALGMHAGEVAGGPREVPQAAIDVEEVDAILARFAEENRRQEGPAENAGRKREDLLSRSGLLIPAPDKRAQFYHLSFQEFLAAWRTENDAADFRALLQQRAGQPAWRRTLVFAFSAYARRNAERALDNLTVLVSASAPEQLSANAAPVLVLADCLEIAHGRGWSVGDYLEPFRRACDAALTGVDDPDSRSQLWRALGRMGLDDRRGVGVDAHGLPDIDWVEIPSGAFPYQDGEPRRLDTVFIARFPVTYSQFQAFVEDPEGYADDRWWDGLAERATACSTPQWVVANQPRETVSWYEAVAFCRWLSERLGYEVRLPTEVEWEKAARGTDRRSYPWGDDYVSGYANIDETLDNVGAYYLRRTTAVGIYPQGASPYGVLDMAGNVWEWCLNKYADPDDVATTGADTRAFRGGSWLNAQGLAAASYRLRGYPDYRNDHLGFRLLCLSPIT